MNARPRTSIHVSSNNNENSRNSMQFIYNNNNEILLSNYKCHYIETIYFVHCSLTFAMANQRKMNEKFREIVDINIGSSSCSCCAMTVQLHKNETHNVFTFTLSGMFIVCVCVYVCMCMSRNRQYFTKHNLYFQWIVSIHMVILKHKATEFRY